MGKAFVFSRERGGVFQVGSSEPVSEDLQESAERAIVPPAEHLSLVSATNVQGIDQIVSIAKSRLAYLNKILSEKQTLEQERDRLSQMLAILTDSAG